jgi:AbrB family looped-hinge helix DNA binding protein
MGSTRTKVDSGGRVVLPVEYRRSLGIRPGDEVVMVLREGEIWLLTPDRALRKAQDLLAPYLAGGDDPVEELLEERRRERDAE